MRWNLIPLENKYLKKTFRDVLMKYHGISNSVIIESFSFPRARARQCLENTLVRSHGNRRTHTNTRTKQYHGGLLKFILFDSK